MRTRPVGIANGKAAMTVHRTRWTTRSLTLGLILCALGSTPAPAQSPEDPFEGFNRGVFAFNQVVDGAFVKPLAMGYRFVVPEFGRARINNALTNIAEPVHFVNGLLHGEPDIAGNALRRFFINTILGLGGLFDVAAALEPPYASEVHREDFGQTMAVWGWADSSYLMLPLFGPSTVRDAIGLGPDFLVVPWGFFAPPAVTWPVFGLRVVSARENVLDQLDDLERSSLDFYASLRTIYLQRRAFDISNGAIGAPDDFFDDNG